MIGPDHAPLLEFELDLWPAILNDLISIFQ
jgi:hypothetical protein